GQLFYGAIIDDTWTFVVDEPGNPTTIAVPILADLHGQGWELLLDDPNDRPYAFAVDWAFVRAIDPDDADNERQFAISQDQFFELTPNSPPSLASVACPLPRVDRQQRLLLAGVEGGALRMNRADGLDLWTKLGPLIVSGRVYGFEADSGTYQIRSFDDPNCTPPLGPKPGPVIEGDQLAVARGSQHYVLTEYVSTSSTRRLLSYGGHCVAHGFGDSTDLQIRDLELGDNLAIVNEQGGASLTWLGP
ncbi:MAG: hypothetical protein KC457_20685, partial [Myxococcales bacterium]|nr:hypothetical protein [Myxococcales bacterium]